MGMEDVQQFDQVGFDDFNGTLHRHALSDSARGTGGLFLPAMCLTRGCNGDSKGYRRGMREKKLKPVLITARNVQSFGDFGQESVGRILSQRSRPTAVLAGNDEIGVRTLASVEPARDQGADEISLVGFDDRRGSGFDGSATFNGSRPQEEIGETCMKMLLERLHHPQMAFSQRVLPLN